MLPLSRRFSGRLQAADSVLHRTEANAQRITPVSP